MKGFEQKTIDQLRETAISREKLRRSADRLVKKKSTKKKRPKLKRA